MLDPVDHQLLGAVQAALAVPFADPVLLREPGGKPIRTVSRRDARAMERMLLKLRALATPTVRSTASANARPQVPCSPQGGTISTEERGADAPRANQ